MKNLTALLLAIILIISAYLPTVAAGQPSKYSTSSNSGERDVLCTTLNGTTAASYYTGSYSYDSLDDLSSSELLKTLRTLMTETHKKDSSYDDCKSMASKTDCENNNGKITMIYTSYQGTHSEYNGGNGWNREHVWPKSLGGFNTSGPGADLHHIRPSENRTNSNRGNLKYGNVSSGKTSAGNLSGLTGGTYSGYYEPVDNAKGDVARICLYMYVRYGGSYSKCSKITNVFQSVEVLLEWCELDPVDTWEMGRNEVIAAYQGNRNVFIDYPELAWLLFDKNIPANMSTPSGGEGSGNQGGSDNGCAHTNTTVKNVVKPTCARAGYSGDTYCLDCDTKIQTGRTLVASGVHSYGDWTLNEDGTEQTRTCSVCGRVETSDLGGETPPISSDGSILPDHILDAIGSDSEIILIYLTIGITEELLVGELSN